MWICEDLAFVLIHVPKTGGQAVTASLKKAVSGAARYPGQSQRAYHRTAREVKAVLGEEWDTRYFSFGFVRNTWARYFSLFNFSTTRAEPDVRRHFARFGSFRAWVLDWLVPDAERDPAHHQMNLSQLDFLHDGGRCLVDFVGRHSTLASDFDRVCLRLGLSCELPWVNRSPHAHYADHYDADTRQAIARRYQDEIRVFGFQFGEDW